MPTSRRKFLKLFGILGVAGVTSVVASKYALNRSDVARGSSQEDTINPPQYGMIIDLDLCDGCNDQDEDVLPCLKACAEHHYIPKLFKLSGEKENKPQPWIELFEKVDNPLSGSYELSRPCMHCQSPPCLHVCPTGATFKNEMGLILINHEICIGCRMCMAACPYNARFFNWGEPEPMYGTREEEKAFFKGRGKYSPEFPGPHQKGTVEKCDFCSHSAKEGDLPACIMSCPQGALYFGDLNENLVHNGSHDMLEVSSIVETRMGFRLHEELGTKPRVYYLPKRE